MRREVSAAKTMPATYCLWVKKYPLLVQHVVIDLFHALVAYQRATQTFQNLDAFVVEIPRVHRVQAPDVVKSFMEWIVFNNPHVELDYTIDWWHRTPSDAGPGPMLIGFREIGLYELAGV